MGLISIKVLASPLTKSPSIHNSGNATRTKARGVKSPRWGSRQLDVPTIYSYTAAVYRK